MCTSAELFSGKGGELLMEESMKDYEKELEASFRKISEGDLISGTVIDVNEEEVTLDLKYYAQGIIKAEDMSNDPSFSLMTDVAVGDEIEAEVISMDDGHGNILLSKKEAQQDTAWDVLKTYLEEKKELTVKVSEVVNAGVVAMWKESVDLSRRPSFLCSMWRIWHLSRAGS